MVVKPGSNIILSKRVNGGKEAYSAEVSSPGRTRPIASTCTCTPYCGLKASFAPLTHFDQMVLDPGLT